MKIVYLHYSGQSGVISHLSSALTNQGAEITFFNAANNVRYRMKKHKFFSFRPHNIVNVLISAFKYGKNWKRYFLRTSFAFRLMSGECEKYLNKNPRIDMILQSGVLFSAGRKKPDALYCLYIDHTYAISKKYGQGEGLPDSKCASKRWERLERETYYSADIIFTMSDFVKKSLVSDYGVEENKIKVVCAGPNLKSVPAYKPSISEENQKTLLFVGKDFIRKGGKVLLESFEMVKRTIPEAKLIIAGPPEEIRADGIEYLGPVAHEKMSEVYGKAAVFVLPTLREPFGLAFLEAMAHGLPCIGTEVEAVPEIITEGKTGFMVPASDITALNEKIIMFLNDQEKTVNMGRNGYDKVRNKYNWDSVAKNIIKEAKTHL